MIILLTAILLILNLITGYLVVIGFFLFKKRKPYPAVSPNIRYAVVIPARNEASVIGNLVHALNRQDYPRELYDVYVAVNHCTDDTARVAEAAGARVIQCSDRVRCKGDVLHEVVELLLPQRYDAFAVFDADNVPAPDFLQRMNDALNASERVCKCCLRGSNPSESWVSGGYSLWHTMMEWTYSRACTAAGFSSNLVGTGFVIHREVLDKLGGWNTTTMCEDTEILAQSTLLGHRVAWVAEAVSLDEQVADFGVSLYQRHRWCYGMIQCARKYGLQMFSRKNPRPGMARNLGMLFLISHTQPVLLLLSLLLMILRPEMILLSLPELVLSYLGLLVSALILCYLGKHPTRRMLPAIFMFPLYMASWIPVQVLALFVPVRRWRPVIHKGAEIHEPL